MTIRVWYAERFDVPGVAMTVDALLNVFLINVLRVACWRIWWRDVVTRSRPVRRWAGFCRRAWTGRTGDGRCACRNYWVPLAPPPPINLLVPWRRFTASGGFLGIYGYGDGWDKTRVGLLVLVAGRAHVFRRHVVQDKLPMKW